VLVHSSTLVFCFGYFVLVFRDECPPGKISVLLKVYAPHFLSFLGVPPSLTEGVSEDCFPPPPSLLLRCAPRFVRHPIRCSR